MKRQMEKSKSCGTSSATSPKNKSCSSSQTNTSVGESTTPIPPHEGTSAATLEVQGTQGSQATELEDDGSVENILEALKRKERRIGDWGVPNALFHGGKNLHVRCVAYILNLIVNDGLSVMKIFIGAIYNALRYVRSSPQRLDFFKECVEMVKLECKGLVILDIPTRWNSTFLILERTLKFQKAFDRIVDEDGGNFWAWLQGDKVEKPKEGPPMSVDWQYGEQFVDFLRPFYEITLKVCCSNSPTVHSIFGDLLSIYGLLQEQKNPRLSKIASPMQYKFQKYWGSFDKLNHYLFIAIVLDPRHKLEKVVDYFEILDDGDMDENMEANIRSVKDILFDLYKVYEEEGRESGVSEVGGSQVSSEGISSSTKGLTELERRLKEIEQKRRAKKAAIVNNDVDRYIGDPIEGDGKGFDLLNWWRVNGVCKYPILARIAKDILAIPVSTIASESSFSTSGRIIDPYRSSLSPRMVEALICTQNWLRSKNVYLHHMPTIEEMKLCEEAERDA